MGNKQEVDRIDEVAPGFFNIRASFKKFVLDIGTHMSIIRLESGKFLVVDTVPLDDKLKGEIDTLTDNGKLMEAVIATHPFHTLAFPAFYEAYPNVPYFGTPRHLRNQQNIPWEGSIKENLEKWSPEIQLRIPEGSEFDNPLPESNNHFSAVWVFHPASKTMHVDDTIMYYKNVSGVIGILTKITGISGSMGFHPSLKGPGLYHTHEAPENFKNFVTTVLKDWDFDNICCAHIGNKIGGAHELLTTALEEEQPTFDKLSEKYNNVVIVPEGKPCKKGEKIENGEEGDEGQEEIVKYNVAGDECG